MVFSFFEKLEAVEIASLLADPPPPPHPVVSRHVTLSIHLVEHPGHVFFVSQSIPFHFPITIFATWETSN
jgi:hypothetical protein